MENIIYKEFGKEYIDQIIEIYKENSWYAYLDDLTILEKSIDNSLYILGAFENDKLIGFIRCVGDGYHIVYIQDLIIRPGYYRRSIGKNLYQKTSCKFKYVRQFLLITDANDKVSNNFYRKMEMIEGNTEYPVRTYIRQ
jgi:hypothetical protein